MMFTMPVYDMMLLPGVTFYFKNDIFQQMGSQDAKTGDDVLFLMQRSDKDRKDLTAEDFYPVGVSGKLDSVDNEGNIRIRTVARVDLSDLEMAEDGILANASIRPDTEDITPEEEKAIFDRVKNVLLNYISQFQWGVLARNYVLHWKNLEETLCAVSGYIHIPWEDKYRIIETDSRKERCELIEKAIRDCENEMDDDAESIITNQRYAYISKLVATCVKKGKPKGSLTTSDKIDRIVTNRWLGLPIFVVIMWFVYWVSIQTIGDIVTGFTNDVFVGEWIQAPVMAWLESIGTAGWLVGLIGDGIIGGVGAVIGFVPQMLILFIMLGILEDVGYMARVAFIMDRIFRKFGLSGKSFIPMLIGSGCGVPGVMASRTIENDRDRKMTIMTTTFIPCGAKMPIVGLIAGALFGNSGWVSTGAYFIGVAAVIVSGIMLKKTKMFAGDPAPFVMELPAYHAPVAGNVLRSMWERGWSFIKRAGTVILISSIFIWFTSSYGWAPAPAEPAAAETEAAQTEVSAEELNAAAEAAIAEAEGPVVFGAVENSDQSILGKIGGAVAPVFEPLGFGNWQSTVATVMGLVAKEEVVGVFGVLFGVTDEEGEDAAMGIVEDENMSNEEKSAALSPIAQSFDESSGGHGQLAAFAFLIFNLLCAPCFAAMGAIKREMNNGKWTAFAIGYQCLFAYAVALTVYQLGLLFAGAGFGVGTAVALLLVAFFLYMLLRKNRYDDNRLTQKVKVGA